MDLYVVSSKNSHIFPVKGNLYGSAEIVAVVSPDTPEYQGHFRPSHSREYPQTLRGRGSGSDKSVENHRRSLRPRTPFLHTFPILLVYYH